LNEITIYAEAVKEIKNAILQSRYRVAKAANNEMLSLYYNVGQYVSENSRAGKWGTSAIETISEQLQAELPGVRGFSPMNIKYMRTFYEQWSLVLEPTRHLTSVELANDRDEPNRHLPSVSLPEPEIHLIIRQIPSDELTLDKKEAFLCVGFTHHREILTKAKDFDERWYYIRRCAAEFWTVLSLKDHLRSDDYHAYGELPNNFSVTITNEKLAARAIRSFKDNYLLDFIDIRDPDDYDERDVQDGIIKDVRKFIMACGEGFCYIGHQFRMIISETEFFVDLLFFNRNLQCLVAFELKREVFTPSDLGQLNFYLSALDEYVRKPYENKSIGILLCREMDRPIVQLAVRDYANPIGVATYNIENDIPLEYKSLIPIIEGVKQILDGSRPIEENEPV